MSNPIKWWLWFVVSVACYFGIYSQVQPGFSHIMIVCILLIMIDIAHTNMQNSR